ncbi:MAG: hypothetical protein JJT81_01450 [Rubellimicrobium sp.]|nr:hypothetical protein [Rubellimicrobium sp.]
MTQTPPLGLYAYPWDVIDEGASAVLDAVERAGLNALYITTWYHSGMFFLPHNPVRRTYFPQPGALYFTPGDWHAGHPLPPPVSPLCDDWTGFWADLSKQARARGIALCAWMPVLHNSGLGNAYPDVAVENPWGDRITHTLCPSQDKVRDLVLRVVGDVAGMGVFDRILLESIEYLGLRHGHHHEVIGVPLDADVDFLTSLCFCPACLARAGAEGIDGAALRDWVRRTVDAALTGAPRKALDWAGLMAGADGALGKWLDLRRRTVSGLVVETAAAIRAADPAITVAALDFGPLYALGAQGRSWQNGNDLDLIIPAVDELHPTFYFTDPDLLAARVAEYDRLIGGDCRLVPAIRAILPQTDSPAGLAGQLAAASGLASGFTFYNYSFMALPTLDWIRDGLAAHPPERTEA